MAEKFKPVRIAVTGDVGSSLDAYGMAIAHALREREPRFGVAQIDLYDAVHELL